MANTKSAKKSLLQNAKREAINRARKSDVKTALKKVADAIKSSAPYDMVQKLLREATAKTDRAAGKGVLKKQTASRKIGRMAKKVSGYFAAVAVKANNPLSAK